MDFWGLRNLDVISDTLELIADPATSTSTSTTSRSTTRPPTSCSPVGDTIGVFQLESGADAGAHPLACTDGSSRTSQRSWRSTGRGPWRVNMHNDYADFKNGRKPITYFHPDAKEVLADTYGLMIYQESVMRVAQKFAGYSLAEADNLRKACGKKIREMMAKERAGFVEGVERTGYGASLGTELFDIIEKFADYAFNKSHSYGYGFIAYQTAFLKANYPAEYLSALLTSVKTSLEKAAIYLAECRVMGIEVTVPDVNRSLSDFSPDSSIDPATGREVLAISFGLSAVRNVGEGLVELIVAERDENGPFGDFYDFCERVHTNVLNKRTVESLIKPGGSTRWGIRARASSPCSSRSSTPPWRAAASATWASCRSSATWRTREPASTSGCRSQRWSSRRSSGSRSRRRCSGCTSRTTR
jgi:DNA polymerase-3 subunit alpha